MASKNQPTGIGEGDKAPDFSLRDLTGNRHSLAEIAGGKPVLLAFYKVSCPTCQFTFPFLERMYKGRSSAGIGMCAISQDDPESTREFNREFGLTMPALLDTEEEGYRASNDYGLAFVPALFLVEPGGRISFAMTGFEKRAVEELGRRFGAEPFAGGDYVPEWKSG